MTVVRFKFLSYFDYRTNNVAEPAQLQASNAGLSKVFVELVSGDRLSSCQSALSHIMTILELLCNQGTDEQLGRSRHVMANKRNETPNLS